MYNLNLFDETAEYWNKTTFGLRLARIRNERKISARKLSLELGYNKNYIYSIESGRNFPTMEGFFDICCYLGIDPEHFFGSSQEHIFTCHLTSILEKLNENQLRHLYQLAEDLAEISQNPFPFQKL